MKFFIANIDDKISILFYLIASVHKNSSFF